MSRNLFWKFLLVAGLVAWALYEQIPWQGRPLAEAFKDRSVQRDQTWTNIVAQMDRMQAEHPERGYGNVLDAVGTNDIRRYFTFDTANELNPTRAILDRLQYESSGRVKLGLDLQGGTSFLVGMDTSALSTNANRETALANAVEVLRKRVDAFGVAEPIIQPAGDDRILIQLPGLTQAEMEDAKIRIKMAAFLEFRMVHPDSDELIRTGMMEPGYEVLRTERVLQDGTKRLDRYLVKKRPERGLTGKYVDRAMVTRNPVTNKPEIQFELNNEGARLFGEVTSENVGRQLAIVLDGELYSAPVINGPIMGGSGVINGEFTVAEAFQLANVLENPLEAPVEILQQRTVDPSLGKDSIRSGIRASMIAVIGVSVFLLVYYLFAGLVANVALLLNIIILLGVFCAIEATLTLPGIAGVVLTVGMAVDANVLIFERMREEKRAGKSLRGAVTSGYEKAFSTIFDSNLTTLMTAVILIALGSGPVQGFGVTLAIGISTSMFTALVATRLIFDFMIDRSLLKSLPMLHFFGTTKIDFLKWAKPAFIGSWLLIVIGIGYGVFVRGADVLGHDFTGGDALSMSFEEKLPVDEIRSAITTLGVGEPMIQYQKDLATGEEALNLTMAPGAGEQVQDHLETVFPDAGLRLLSIESVGPTVGNEILKNAVIAVLLGLFCILVYVAFRYEFSFAVAAVIAILHDVLMTMGWFFLSGRELSAPIVAAILTIIGFSINDTIVIFDRIREDLKLGVRGTFKDVINIALNQTLSRTVITSGTTLLAAMALYFFGGGVINDFAFTFMVGILTGTYSTIYIAGYIVLRWHRGERPQLGSSAVSVGTVQTAGP